MIKLIKNHKSEIINAVIGAIIAVVIETILGTIAVTYIIDLYNENKTNNSKDEEILKNLQIISIGYNKEWMDYSFGLPVFSNTDELTEEEVYITKFAIIRAFFDIENKNCKAFFITQTTNEPIPLIKPIKQIYINSNGIEKKLGTISYDELLCSGLKLFAANGYFTNGTGRVFYGEGYYCNRTGFYHNLYYASIDYGVNCPLSIMGSFYSKNKLSKEEITYYKDLNNNKFYNYTHSFLHNRKNYYPNTYGISSLDSEYTYKKLNDYKTFYSIQFRN